MRWSSCGVTLGALLWSALLETSGAEVFEISLEGAVRMAHEHSPTSRPLQLQARRDDLSWARARRALWPDLRLDLQAPMLSREFNVEPLPGAGVDTVLTGAGDTLLVTQQVFGKTTTRRTNAVGDLRYRQLLPWKGALFAGGTVYYRDEDTDPEGVRQARLDYQVNAQVGLDLKLLGDDSERRQLRRARIEHEMSFDREQAARAQLTFEATSRYLSLLRASLSLGIVRSALEQTSRAHDQAERKVQAGLLPEVEFLRMRVFLAERQARLAETETQLARQSDAFKVFLGVSPSDSLLLSERLQPFDLDVSLDEAVVTALERRTEIGLLERELALLEMDRRARRPHAPDVSLSLRYGGVSSETALDRAIESLSANNVSLQLSVQLPLWDSGRDGLDEDLERAGIRLRELDLRDRRLEIELEVRDAVRQLRDAKRRHQLFRASSELAEESLRISAERFERGLIDTGAYLGAQAEVATARLGLTGALLDLYQARARLRLVILSEDL
ncbi:MAG: TolC family protein [Candidatus Krumholzibacteriia bacterium]